MSDTLKSVIIRICWSLAPFFYVMLFSIIAAGTQYHGVANLAILGYGLWFSAGIASVIIFARWSVVVVGAGMIAVSAFHVSSGALIAAAAGFALGFAFLLYWRNLDRHRTRRVLQA